jgi:hypothetical protein
LHLLSLSVDVVELMRDWVLQGVEVSLRLATLRSFADGC